MTNEWPSGIQVGYVRDAVYMHINLRWPLCEEHYEEVIECGLDRPLSHHAEDFKRFRTARALSEAYFNQRGKRVRDLVVLCAACRGKHVREST